MINTYPNIWKQILNRKCWRAWDGMLPAVFFEFEKKQNDNKTGEFSLCLDMCKWVISKNKIEVANSESETVKIKSALKLFMNTSISEIYFSEENHHIIEFTNKVKIDTYLRNSKDEWCILSPNFEFIVKMDNIFLESRGKKKENGVLSKS